MRYTKVADIPQFTKVPSYQADTAWEYALDTLEDYKKHYGLDMDPDFQRAHVWTHGQQIAYIEFSLMGGMSARQIYFNCKGFQSGVGKDMVLVDGKQRLEAVRAFLENEFPVFGDTYRRDLQFIPMNLSTCFRFNVNDLPTRLHVLTWYLEMNSGGTPHTDEEINKVRTLVNQEVESLDIWPNNSSS